MEQRAVAVLCAICVLLTIHSVWFLAAKKVELKGNHVHERQGSGFWDSVMLIWSSGWVTAASTGLGVVPFLCLKDLGPWIGISNAFAAGMMLSASAGLVFEGMMEDNGSPDVFMIPSFRVVIGLWTGIFFIRATERYLKDYDNKDILEMDKIDTRRVLLIMGVMTLHSFSEGVGLGVSYHSQSLGHFITATLAIHNVPEGIAISIVLLPRGFSKVNTGLFCVFSSLPQPIMAVPAYLFVDKFSLIAPIGLGFAAGAMGWVALFELLPDALEMLSYRTASIVCVTAMMINTSLILIYRINF